MGLKKKTTKTHHREEHLTHEASVLSGKAGVTTLAQGDTTVIGSHINSEGDISIATGGALDIKAAENKSVVQHKSETKKSFAGIKYSKDKVERDSTTTTAQGSISEAMGDMATVSGGSSTFTASTLKADNINIQAGGQVAFNAAANTHVSNESRESNSFGNLINETATSEVNTTTQVGTQVDATNLQINAQTVVVNASDIKAKTIDLITQQLALVSGKDSHYESHFSDGSGVLLRVIENQGEIKETAVAGTLTAEQITLNGERLSDESLSTERLLQRLSSEGELTHDQLTTLKAELNNQSWHDKQTTLSKMGTLIVQAVASYVTAGTGSGLVSGLGKTLGKTAELMIQKAIQSAANQATQALMTAAITGNPIELDFDEMLKSSVKAGVLAGVNTQMNLKMGYTKMVNGKIVPGVMNLSDELTQMGLQTATETAIYGGDFVENLKSNTINFAGEKGANWIGNQHYLGNANWATHKAAHAALGCALASARKGDCSAGALGAVAGEIAAELAGLNMTADEAKANKARLVLTGQLAAITTAAMMGEDDLNSAYTTATNAVSNNYLTADQRKKAEALLAEWQERVRAESPSCLEFGEECSDFSDLISQLNDLKKISSANTLNLIDVCSQGASDQCANMLAESSDFNEWAGSKWTLNVLWTGDHRRQFVVGGNAIDKKGEWTWMTDLDTRVNETYQKVQSGEISGEAATAQLLTDLAEFDGTVKIVAGMIEVAGITICSAASGGACVMAVAGAVVGANTLGEGIAEVITGKDQLSAIELGLVKAGFSEAEAKKIKGFIEAGVAVATFAEGGIKIISRETGQVVAKLDSPSVKPNGSKQYAGKACSFHGNTQVLTQMGYQAIKDLQVGKHQAWSRNPANGDMAFKTIEAHYSNPYQYQVSVTLKAVATGNTQTIISNRIHPYFVQVPQGENVTQNSEGHTYNGIIQNGRWVDAQHLKAGYRLLTTQGQWAEVTQVTQAQKLLKAYNLTVKDFHTYFVAGRKGMDGVWVHNDCWDELPDSARAMPYKNQYGQQVYINTQNGKRIYKGHDGKYYDEQKHPPTPQIEHNRPNDVIGIRVSEKQGSHGHYEGNNIISGIPKSYMKDADHAKSIIEAYYNGVGEVLSIDRSQNRVFIKVPSVKPGIYVNGDRPPLESNVFMIKGKKGGVNVVPVNPLRYGVLDE